MRVLVVTPYPALPLVHGGRVRTYRLAEGLAAAGAAVDLLCPWRPGLPLRRFQRGGVTLHPQMFAANLLPALLGDRLVSPLVALSWQPFAVGPRLRLRGLSGHDIVQFDFCAHAAWMGRLRGAAKVVYSAHNVEVDYISGRPGRSRSRSLALRRLRRLERLAVRCADLVVACTDADAARLRSLYREDAAVAIVANGFDDELLGFDRGPIRAEARVALGIDDGERCLLFVGGPAVHNREAVRFLERTLLPRLAGRCRLLLAGECVRGSSGGDGVLPLGFLDDLRGAYAAADVAVNPVVGGSGSNVKMASYLAAGVPIVTTPVGLRGFELYRDRVVVSDLDGFADAVLEATSGSRPGARPAGELAWGALGRRLHDEYARLLDA